VVDLLSVRGVLSLIGEKRGEIIRKEFAGIFQAALAAIAGFGEGTPQQDSRKDKMSDKRNLVLR